MEINTVLKEYKYALIIFAVLFFAYTLKLEYYSNILNEWTENLFQVISYFFKFFKECS